MPLVYYVGFKPRRVDTVTGSGITWDGRGDSKEVSDAIWGKLAKHPDIWSLEKPALEASDLPKLPEKPKLPAYALQHADGSVLDLTAMDDKALHAFATENEIKVDAKKKGDALRAAIVEAVKAAAGS
jgi:hypothetical protein